jgi:hypothetical protein
MAKDFGLMKAKKNMTMAERFEIMGQNIMEGKKMEEKMKEVRRVQDQGAIDKNASHRIASIATDLMINKGVGYVEAQEQAKEIYKKEVEADKEHKE